MKTALETDPGYVRVTDPARIAELWRMVGLTPEDIEKARERASMSVTRYRASQAKKRNMRKRGVS